jgi:NAD(P)-dependent dehydrogenase (short-subunit alcohol dehydrogenase family)
MRRFENKVVLVTGAASGIGKAAAERFAEEGARLACLDIQAEAVEQAAKTAREQGAEVFTRVCDVSDPDDVRAAVGEVVTHYGGIDSLCNVAGILHFDHTHELSLEKWNRVLGVNLTGTFLMCQAAIPHLLARSGNIVNVASTAALAGHPWTAAYSASKGGVLALTYTLAIEYGTQGLRANAVCPGSIATPMTQQFELPEGADQKLVRRIMPLDRFRGPEAAASVIVFLASDDAAHVNGERIRADGATLS